MAARVPISYYNSFWMKRTGSIVGASAVTGYTPVWPGIFWSPYNTGVFPINANTSILPDFIIGGITSRPLPDINCNTPLGKYFA